VTASGRWKGHTAVRITLALAGGIVVVAAVAGCGGNGHPSTAAHATSPATTPGAGTATQPTPATTRKRKRVATGHRARAKPPGASPNPSTAPPSPSSAAAPTVHNVSVTLNLQGGNGDESAVACGIRHHYTLYPTGAVIHYNGTVMPAPTGKWKVKIKIKRCGGSRFQDVWSGKVVGGHGGRFSGTIPSQGSGRFFARAAIDTAQASGTSDKQYFHPR
jgi:hypothetical protein